VGKADLCFSFYSPIKGVPGIAAAETKVQNLFVILKNISGAISMMGISINDGKPFSF
jgi:hypothetical protein